MAQAPSPTGSPWKQRIDSLTLHAKRSSKSRRQCYFLWMSTHFVTVVSGLPRSGTSAMMQMLQAGGMPILTDARRPPDEDNPRGYFELEAVKQTKQDPAWLRDAAGKAVKVIHLLLTHLPPSHEYRVILMRRNMNEILASQRKMLNRHGRRGADLTDEHLARVYADQLETVVTWMKSRPNFAMLEMNYAQLVSDPEKYARTVNTFLGGAFAELPMMVAVDRTLYRNRG